MVFVFVAVVVALFVVTLVLNVVVDTGTCLPALSAVKLVAVGPISFSSPSYDIARQSRERIPETKPESFP